MKWSVYYHISVVLSIGRRYMAEIVPIWHKTLSNRAGEVQCRLGLLLKDTETIFLKSYFYPQNLYMLQYLSLSNYFNLRKMSIPDFRFDF